MIPLHCEKSPNKFSCVTVTILSIWGLAHLYSFWIPKNRPEFLLELSLYPNDIFSWRTLTSFFFFENNFHFVVSALYFWVFTPKLFQEISVMKALLIATLASAMSLFIFCGIHSSNSAPILCTDVFLGALLGAFMRRDIWGVGSLASNRIPLDSNPRCTELCPSVFLVFLSILESHHDGR